ncbi:hypothetical protein P9202_1736 [Prochlorococcus marinus str. MIT 9202]|nr:hypothetical protein P9202_1736 [Prochlorococcus marinus str. MIT 9202]
MPFKKLFLNLNIKPLNLFLSIIILTPFLYTFSRYRGPILRKGNKIYLSLKHKKYIEKLGDINSVDSTMESKIANSNRYYDDHKNKINFDKLKNYRFRKLVISANDFFKSKNAINIGLNLRNQFWENYDYLNNGDEINKFKLLIGYHDLIFPNIKDCSLILVEKNLKFSIYDINCKNRYNFPVRAFIGIPSKQAKGVVLAIHGKNSGPDNIIGIAENDYNKKFASGWLEKEFITLSPWVNPEHGINPNLAGLSAPGLDLSNLLDWIEFLKFNYPNKIKSNLIVHGLSYGSLLAEYVGIISNNVSCVISSGGAARGSLLLRAKYNNNLKKGSDSKYNYDTFRKILFDGPSLYKLIFPKKLIISIGIRDRENNAKFEIIDDISAFYSKYGFKNNLKINLHDGAHIPDFDGEYKSFISF